MASRSTGCIGEWGLRGKKEGKHLKVGLHAPGRVECTPSSKLVSSTGNLRRSSTSAKVVGFLKNMEAKTSNT